MEPSTLPIGTTPSFNMAKLIFVMSVGIERTVESGESRSQNASWTWWPDFAAMDINELIHLLEDPSLPVRQFARQQLWQQASENPDQIREAIDRWASQNPAERNLERNWIYEVLEQPTGDEFREAIDSVAPVARRTMIRSLWRQRQELGADAMRGVEQAVLERVNDDDPRVRLEAVVSAGQLDADDHLDAFRAVLDATNHDVDDNLDFAIWQSIRSLDASYDDGSILTAMNWEDAPDKLALAVSAIGTDQAAEVAVNLLEAGKVGGESLDAIVNSIALAGNASQLGSDGSRPATSRYQPAVDETIPASLGSNVSRQDDPCRHRPHTGTDLRRWPVARSTTTRNACEDRRRLASAAA